MAKELNLLYFNQFVRGAAFSLVGIFIPIYLLTSGFSLSDVFTYFLIFHIANFVFTFLILTASKKIGYKPIFIGSMIFAAVFLILLQKDFSSPFFIPLIALIFGVQEASYYLPFHAFFTRVSEQNKRGASYSSYSAFGQLSGLIAPLLGALIVFFLGFSYLFLIGIILLVFSITPIFYLSNIKPLTKLSFSRVRDLTKKHKKFFLGTMASDIMSETHGIVWTIFVYLTLASVLSVGWVGTLATAGSILFTLFIGKFYDKKNKYLFLKIGGLLYFVLWITRIYFDTPAFIFASTILAGFLVIMTDIPFSSMFYDKAAEEKDSDEFIVVREIPTLIARSFFWILMILLVNKFIVAFVLAGLASLLLALIGFTEFNSE